MASESSSDEDEILFARVRRKYSIPIDKTKTLVSEDRIGKLPDSILLHILTFLPITDAIHTTLLSKRWNHLWSSIPTLVFRFDHDRFYNVDEFISFVHRTLNRSNSDVILRFCLDFIYSNSQELDVDSWLRFALNHKVEELDLIFHESYKLSGDRYILPGFLFRNGTLIKLNLGFCSFSSCGAKIYWGVLRKLSISHCFFRNGFMEKLMAGCPVLESLELHYCSGFDKIDIASIALKELVINGDDEWENDEDDQVDDELKISAPYLQLLVISGHMGSKKCRVQNVSSWVEVRLCADWASFAVDFESSLQCKTMIVDILRNLNHVKKLMLGNFCLQVISLRYYNALFSPFPICKSLILDANLEKGGLHGLASMLQSCAELETLTIHLLGSATVSNFPYDLSYTKKSFWPRCDNGKYSNCIRHLKMVKIIGLTPGCSQIELVIEFLQFLLKHAHVLKKILINTKQYSQQKCAKSLFAVAQTLLKIPRSSPFAEIQLC